MAIVKLHYCVVRKLQIQTINYACKISVCDMCKALQARPKSRSL